MAGNVTREDYATLIAAEREVGNFAGQLYHDQSVFGFEQHAFSDLWHYCCPQNELVEEGAFREFEAFGQSLIVWNTGGAIRAFANICRHRGAPILNQDARGKGSKLTCPYHAWCYGPRGALQTAPTFDFGEPERSEHGLVEFPVLIVSGVVFVALQEKGGADVARIEGVCAKLWSYHGLESSQVAASRVFDVAANWKLVVENFLECYHCLPNHPHLSSVCDHTKISATDGEEERKEYGKFFGQWIARARKLGTPVPTRQQLQIDDAQFAVCYRCAIKSGFDTLTQDGSPVAPLMGQFSDYDGGETFGYVGPFLHFSLANDHAIMIRVNPVSSEATQVVVEWLVDANIDVAARIDVERLTWLWGNTVAQDVELVERAQTNVKSPAFRPGPYSPLEGDLAAFKQWYLARVRNGPISLPHDTNNQLLQTHA